MKIFCSKIVESRRGISLITLVITIIVIIILAGAIILSLANDNIISFADNAVKQQLKSNVIETYNLLLLDNIENSALDGTQTDITLEKVASNLSTSKEYLEKNGYNIDVNGNLTLNGEIIASKNAVMDDTENTKIPSPMGGKVFVDNDNKEAPIPKGFVASSASGENLISNGLVIYEGNEAVTNTNVDNAQTTRNQFVWIPVSDIEGGYIRRAFRGELLGTTNPSGGDTEEHYIQYSELQEYKDILESVKKYNGFYISRYEASVATGMSTPTSDTTDKYATGTYKPKFIKRGSPWNYIKFSTNGTNDMNGIGNGALKVSRTLYNSEENNRSIFNNNVSRSMGYYLKMDRKYWEEHARFH